LEAKPLSWLMHWLIRQTRLPREQAKQEEIAAAVKTAHVSVKKT
jgi:hypothetical protein